MSRTSFEPYISEAEVEAGLKSGALIKGAIRVSSNSPGDAFCVRDGSNDGDIFIEGKWNRNRAFNGDIVTVRIYEQSPEQSKGSVVFVHHRTWEDRAFVCSMHANSKPGTADPEVKADDKFVRAVPIDKRTPWILIAITDPIKRMLSLPGELDSQKLYTVHVMKWAENSSLPLGRVQGNTIGRAGNVAVEERVCLIEAHLEEHALEFSPQIIAEVEAMLGTGLGNARQGSEGSYVYPDRTDFRSMRVCTIDPKTARDLDDAIHIEIIDHKTVEIGVHIADVSHFLTPGSETDLLAQDRCTSVYLCHKVFPMLPEQLSNGVCSLTANEDKLTFSCWFRIDRHTGELIPGSERFGKSVINSCCRLNYEQVQTVIDGGDFSISERPITHHGVTWKQLVGDLKVIFQVTGKIRKKRFEDGTMKIHKEKMVFHLNDTDEPTGYHLEDHTASHWMIEELMLMANKLVSVFISTASEFDADLQAAAVLRRHPAPDHLAIRKVASKVKELLGANVLFDYSTSKTLYTSLQGITTKFGSDVGRLIEYLVMKCMRPAEYITLSEAEDVSHFALAFEFYTHFTSPIRRYADILVHRELEWCLNKMSGQAKPAAYQLQCEKCNDKKKRSRLAQEAADVSWFCMYLRKSHKLHACKATVVQVMEKQVVVFVPILGKEVPVFFKLNAKIPGWYLPEEMAKLSEPAFFGQDVNDPATAIVKWNTTSALSAPPGFAQKAGDSLANELTQSMTIFDVVTVAIVPLETVPISYATLLVPPGSTLEA